MMNVPLFALPNRYVCTQVSNNACLYEEEAWDPVHQEENNHITNTTIKILSFFKKRNYVELALKL